MVRTPLSTFLLLALTLAAAAADAPSGKPAPAPEAPPKPNEIDRASLDGLEPGVIVHTKLPDGRPWSLYVPKAYAADRAWPVLIECTGRGVGRENIRRMWQVADEFGLIVAAPDTYAIFGRPGNEAEVTKTHEAWSRSGQSVDVPQTVRDQEDILRDLRADAAAIGQVVDQVAAKLSLERRCVVLTGYSGGAWVAYWTGISAPQTYAGICVRSGTFHPGVMPRDPIKARTMPVNVVIGDHDMAMVLKDTDKAERWFKRMKFERFEVERLPNSGHDNRPEAAGNFARFLHQQFLAAQLKEATAQRDKYLTAAKKSLERDETGKARHWLQRAAEVERKHAIEPAEASELLARLDAGGGPCLVDAEKDLISLHYDHAPDRDDGQSAAADRTVLQTLYSAAWVREHVVAVSGAYGTNKERFNRKSDKVMDVTFGDLGGWVAADRDWDAAVEVLLGRWKKTLASGGDIWVKEGGQSDITADLVRRIKEDLPDVKTKKRIHVVQHSNWNEGKTTKADLAYTKVQTHYIRIKDANRYLNVKGGNAAFEKAALAHPAFGPAWKAAFEYYPPSHRLDFSDTGELLHMLGLGELSIDAFRERFLETTQRAGNGSP